MDLKVGLDSDERDGRKFDPDEVGDTDVTDVLEGDEIDDDDDIDDDESDEEDEALRSGSGGDA